MIEKQKINELLGINESYEMPVKLMGILFDKEKREELFDRFMELETDLNYDWFTDYYQEEHGDRDKLKQDFTPDGICKAIQLMNGYYESNADICSGTGGLTIKNWNNQKDAFYHCEEIASRAIPVLLFNLAIRGVNGQVIHGNALTNEKYAVYRLSRNGRYSDITQVDEVMEIQPKSIIMNPPYSLKWENAKEYEHDSRYERYGVPPTSKADYAFLLHGLSKMHDNGTLFAVLPHGVLFRGQQEGKIRQKLIEDNLIDAVIGLPDKLFLNTQIPVCILVVKKKRTQKDILFIDASKQFVKGGKQNTMSMLHVQQIADTYKYRKEVEKYSHLASLDEIEKNDFNLNIPRYVDNFEQEELPDIIETLRELHQTDMEIIGIEKELLTMMKQMYGTSKETQKELDDMITTYEKHVNEKRSKKRKFKITTNQITLEEYMTG